MRGMRIAAAAAISLGLCVLNRPAQGETTYTVIPRQCGGVLNLLQCAVNLSPSNSIGIYPTLQIADDLVKNTGGLVDWSTTRGPAGRNLGIGVIRKNSQGHYLSYPVWNKVCSNGSCAEQVTALTVYFEGEYIGGGIYAGYYTLHMRYQRQYSLMGGWKWVRTVTGGLVTLTQ